MVVRLTKTIRERVQDALLHRRFSKDAEALAAHWAILAQKVFEAVLNPTQRKVLSQLPPDWLPTRSSVSVVRPGGQRFDEVPFNGWIHRIHKSEFYPDKGQAPAAIFLPVPNYLNHRAWLVMKSGDPLDQSYEELDRVTDDLVTQYKQARLQTAATMEQFSTVGGLIKGWPEVEPFAGRFNVPDGPRLPAVISSELNQMLRLPVEDAHVQ